FPRALELARRTQAHVLAGLPLEPVVLGELARAQGIDPGSVGLDALFLGGAPVPPALQRRLARVWGARGIALYGATGTLLLRPAGSILTISSTPRPRRRTCSTAPSSSSSSCRVACWSASRRGLAGPEIPPRRSAPGCPACRSRSSRSSPACCSTSRCCRAARA